MTGWENLDSLWDHYLAALNRLRAATGMEAVDVEKFRGYEHSAAMNTAAAMNAT